MADDRGAVPTTRHHWLATVGQRVPIKANQAPSPVGSTSTEAAPTERRRSSQPPCQHPPWPTGRPVRTRGRSGRAATHGRAAHVGRQPGPGEPPATDQTHPARRQQRHGVGYGRRPGGGRLVSLGRQASRRGRPSVGGPSRLRGGWRMRPPVRGRATATRAPSRTCGRYVRRTRGASACGLPAVSWWSLLGERVSATAEN